VLVSVLRKDIRSGNIFIISLLMPYIFGLIS